MLSNKAFAAFREGGQIVCSRACNKAMRFQGLAASVPVWTPLEGWGDPDAGGLPSGLEASLASGVVKVCS